MRDSLRSLTKNERFAQKTDERISSPGYWLLIGLRKIMVEGRVKKELENSQGKGRERVR